MDYVLFLRRKERDPDARDRVLTALRSLETAAPTPADAPLPATWLVRRAMGTLTVRAFPPGEDPAASPTAGAAEPWGFDLSAPGSASRALAEDLCQLAFSLADEGGLAVYDPQLGRTLKAEEGELVVERIRKHSTYFTESVGIDRPTASVDVDRPGNRLTGRAKLFLGLGAALLGLALLAQFCPL